MLRQLLHNLGGNLRNLGIAGVAILFERDERDEDDEDDAFDGPVRTQAATESPSAGPCPRPPDLQRLVNRAIEALIALEDALERHQRRGPTVTSID